MCLNFQQRSCSVVLMVSFFLSLACSIRIAVADEKADKNWADDVAKPNIELAEPIDEEQVTREVNRISKALQALKKDTIDLNKDLRLMEEALLFPSSTKFSVFVSITSGQFFVLEGVKLKIDGRLVTAHIYSEKQRQALIRGGIHKLYVTNINEGKHSATAFFTGVGPNGRSYKRATTLDFVKGVGSQYLEIKIGDDSETQEPIFGMKQW